LKRTIVFFSNISVCRTRG